MQYATILGLKALERRGVVFRASKEHTARTVANSISVQKLYMHSWRSKLFIIYIRIFSIDIAMRRSYVSYFGVT